MHWWPCCLGGCLTGIAEDTFDRPDNTDLGSLWDERSGDWSIDSNRLKEAGNSGALCVCTTAHPKNAVSCNVTINTINESVGDVFRIVVNYVDDSNFHYAQLTIGSTSVIIDLYKKSGGADTLLETQTYTGKLFTTRLFRVCFTDQVFGAFVSNPLFSQTWTTNVTAHAGGIKVGVGNGGTSLIYIDDFLFWEHYDTNHDCPSCRCWCQDIPIPKVLTATFSGTGQLTCADGETITLNWRQSDSNWYGTGTICGVTWELLLLCHEGAAESIATNFRLQVQSTVDCCSGDPENACDFFAAEGSTCDPINFEFGPFSVPMGDLLCNCCSRTPGIMDSTFSWTITE